MSVQKNSIKIEVVLLKKRALLGLQIFAFMVFSLQNSSVFAQNTSEVWSLEKCISHARANNRSIKQGQLAIGNAELSKKQATFDRYPSVSAGSNFGFNFGRSVNPSTYTFENTTTNFNAWSLSANVILYNGGRINNTIHQTTKDVAAAKADQEQFEQTLALQVAQAYLQILLNEEQLENSKKRIEQDRAQLERIEKQIRAGALAPNAKFDLQAQIARDEQQMVSAENAVELSFLGLKNLLELSPEQNIRLEKPQVVVPADANPEGFAFKALYARALQVQPQVRAGELRIQSANLGVKIAKAQLLPVLSASGNIGTNYSSTIRDFTKAPTTVVESRIPSATVDGVPVDFRFKQLEAGVAPKVTYFNQFADNLGQGVGLNLQIPIFDGFSRRIGVERQVLNVKSQELGLERTKEQLKTDVQTAIANARAAKKQYQAAQKTFEAQGVAYDALEKRFSVGGTSSFELTQAKANLDTAERDFTVSKYDYLFKLKIVDFYEGKTLSLK
jgi:outer membrane protein